MSIDEGVDSFGFQEKQITTEQQNALTRNAIPATGLYNHNNLIPFLRKHRVVYLKPEAGSLGLGIIRINLNKQGQFVIQFAGRRTVLVSEAGLQQAVNRMMKVSEAGLQQTLNRTKKYRQYVMQRAIRSVTADGRPFDIRVHVLRRNEYWVVSGMVGKVGGIGRIVTNHHRGGKPVPVEYLLRTLVHLDPQRTA